MDNIGRQSFNSESLKQTLNCYQLSSVDSLSGPSSHYALAAHLFYKENKQSPPIPPPPLIQIPLLIPNDTSTIRSQTLLAGESVSCFIVGGEKRLCLPQILSTVLRDYSISEINRTCADLHIYCSRCSPEQLDYLKKFGILPFNATQCGLITKSDAERLVASLGVEYHLNTKQDLSKLEGKGFRVYHRCFGRGDGILYLELYTSPDSPCITCIDCRTTFSPSRFVAHSHRGLEKRTCHWGFDPENWRHYLLVPKEQGDSTKCENEKLLEAMKAKFDVSNVSRMSPLKRRQQESDTEQSNVKRLKDDPADRSPMFLSPQRLIPPFCYGSLPLGIRPSAFKPWADGIQVPDVSKTFYDEALKALQPMVHGADRRLLPGYVQLGNTPAAISSSEAASDWNNLMSYSNVTPNIKLVPGEKPKKTIPSSPASKDLSVKRDQSSSLSSIVKVEQPDDVFARDNRSDKHQHRTDVRSSATTLPDDRRPDKSNHLSDLATTARSKNLPTSCRSKSVKVESTADSNQWSSSSDASRTTAASESRLESNQRATDLSSSSSSLSRTDKPIPPLLAMSKAVAAASAMLELSSSGLDNSTISKQSKVVSSTAENLTSSVSGSDARQADKDRHHCQVNSKVSSSRPAPLTLMVLPIDKSHQHFKWSFGNESYFISASGTQDLKQLNSILDEACNSEVAKHQVLKELVKTKAKYEEKLDIQARVRKDLETELDHAKVSKRKRLEEASAARRELRREIERLRDDHHEKMAEASNTISQRDKQISELKSAQRLQNSSSSSSSGVGNDDRTAPQSTSNTHNNCHDEMLDNLHRKMKEQETELTTLRSELIVEKDKREELETKLKDISDRSGGRIPFLMDGPLSTMIREARKHDDAAGPGGRGSVGNGASLTTRQSIESIASTICKHNSIKTALEHDCHSKGGDHHDHRERTPVKSSDHGRGRSSAPVQESINLTTSPITSSRGDAGSSSTA